MKDNIKKEDILKALDDMIEDINSIKKKVEYDKKVLPYLFLTNLSDENGAIKTRSLSNLDGLSQVGLIEGTKLSILLPRK